MSNAGTKYHVELEDPASGETLGLMLAEAGGTVDRMAQLANPYAAKIGGGDMQLSDLSDLSVYAQTDWTGGRGQELFAPDGDEDKYYDSRGLETRIKGQITLGPLPQQAAVESSGGAGADAPSYEPTSITAEVVGYPGKTINESGSSDESISTDEEAQRFYTSGGFKITTIELYLKKDSTSGNDLTVSIYSDASGVPGSSLASATIARADMGTSYAWETATLSSSYECSAGYYWIVCEISGYTSSTRMSWAKSTSNPYPYGYRCSGTAGGSWTKYTSEDFRFRIGWEKKYRAMSITAPSGGLSCTHVYLFIRKTQDTIAQNYTCYLRDDDGGSPAAASLKSATISNATLSTTLAPVKLTWASAQALSASTDYWVTIEPGATADSEYTYLEWGGDGAASYASGASKEKSGSESWAADATTDMWIRINDATVAQGGDMTVNPIRFNGNWYMAGGDVVYKWNSATPRWDRADAQASETVTSMAVFNGKLYAARGANNMRECNTSDTWSDVNWSGAIQAQIVFAYNRYLFYTLAANKNQLAYSADASTWYTGIDICPSDWGATALAGWRGENDLWVGTEIGLYRNLLQFADQVLDFRSLENADNCKALTYWAKTADLYIPILYGLYRWNGGTNVPIGPDQGTGLPAARTGKIMNMWGTVNWLFAAVDAGASNTSSLLATDGMGAWHEVARAATAGDRIRAVGYETISSPPRVWYSEGDKVQYLELPDYSDNPTDFSSIAYAAEGELITSWWGTELLQVTKDLRSVVVHAEDCATAQTLRVSYEVDRSGTWTLLGTIDDGRPIHRIDFPITACASKTIGASSTTTTINLSSGDTTDLTAGSWVRISNEIRQVESITDSDTFVLEVPLSSAAAATSGNTVYGSRPAGTEFRLKLELQTTSTTASPKLLSIAVYCQANVLDRWSINLGVEVKDGLECLDKTAYPLDPPALIAALEGWVTKKTAFTLHDIWGVDRTVKVSNASSSGIRRVTKGQNQVPARYSGLYRLTLTEVDVG
jgi:hypothetical protein